MAVPTALRKNKQQQLRFPRVLSAFYMVGIPEPVNVIPSKHFFRTSASPIMQPQSQQTRSPPTCPEPDSPPIPPPSLGFDQTRRQQQAKTQRPGCSSRPGSATAPGRLLSPFPFPVLREASVGVCGTRLFLRGPCEDDLYFGGEDRAAGVRSPVLVWLQLKILGRLQSGAWEPRSWDLAMIPSFCLVGSQDDKDAAPSPRLGGGALPPKNTPGCPANCTCPSEETVECGGLDLHVFPSNVSRAVQHLSLQNNQLRELPYDELAQLTSLKTLNLHNNHIISDGLPDEAFESLDSLQYIYLANNKLTVAPQILPSTVRIVDLAANLLTEVYPLTFGQKANLSSPPCRSVYLHNNQLTNTGLPYDAFNGSDTVSTMILSSNQLSYLPQNLPPALVRLHLQWPRPPLPAEQPHLPDPQRGAEQPLEAPRALPAEQQPVQPGHGPCHLQRPVPLPLCSKLKSLEYLDLSNNNLTEIPAGFPPNIVILHLGKNRIGSLPRDSLSRVRGLQYLLLQNNRLTAAGVHPDAFLKLRHLHTLHLYNNRLERVPPGLPRRVRSLMILHNQITHIGLHDFANTYLLAELNLSYNRLYSAKIHRLAFRKLRRLENLDLSGNQLTLLPAGLPPSLEVLKLHKNQLNSLSPELLANLAGLKELHLAHNRLRIGSITPGTWQELQGLKLLDLSNNELSYIPPDLPESLEYLYLQHNRIAVIGAEAFHTIPDIRAIVLRSNRLLAASVSDQAFAALKQLEVVDTTGNPEPISIKMPRAGRWLRSHPGP
ncbi:podocan-like protein 1 isoform X3 [Chrysemys picta bellii]|uniref:podocan-like protein 1 isoform X3 n=1 Tax=Chrysemys picta bellii TaxID=8478 RepID=UPI0032B1AFAC